MLQKCQKPRVTSDRTEKYGQQTTINSWISLKKTFNPSSFGQDEKNFYLDQQSLVRKMALSKDIDEEHEKEVVEQCIVLQDLTHKEQIERNFTDKLSRNEL